MQAIDDSNMTTLIFLYFTAINKRRVNSWHK
jgi:hypothetical protein